MHVWPSCSSVTPEHAPRIIANTMSQAIAMMFPRLRYLLLLAGLIALSGCALFQPKIIPPCSEAAYHQFDFWLGEWNVLRAGDESGDEAYNSITPIMQGCALQERYHTSSGYSGESLNWYDPELMQWRQTWVDVSGTVLQLSGGLNAEGQMVLSGNNRRDERDKPLLDRITWTPYEDGTVVQQWDISRDNGATWERIFSGLYEPRVPAQPAQPESPAADNPGP